MSHVGEYFDVVRVSTGQSQVIGTRRDKPVLSSIGRRPITSNRVELTFSGIRGDTQTNPKVHGGPEKAIYMYPEEHYAAWCEELSLDEIPVPSFGENLTVRGLTEEKVREDDLFDWGDTRLQVVKYRQPCANFNLFWGRDDMVERMRTNGLCGWYLRVVRIGEVDPAKRLYYRYTDPDKPTIAEMFRDKVARLRAE